MTYLSHRIEPANDGGLSPETRFAFLFWGFSYALLTLRAVLAYDVPVLLTIHRICATGAGAIIFWFVLSHIDLGSDARAKAVFGLKSIIPAMAAMLLARLALNLVWAWPSDTLAENLRWVLAWSGYYAVWLLAGTMLLRHPPAIDRSLRTAPIERAAATTTSAPTFSARAVEDASAWEWLVDRMTAELADAPLADRAVLLDRLLASGGYELADTDDPAFERSAARARLIERLFR